VIAWWLLVHRLCRYAWLQGVCAIQDNNRRPVQHSRRQYRGST